MKNKKISNIAKTMTIQEVLNLDESLGEVFMGFGMFCIFCHLGENETIEEACSAHGVEVDFLIVKLNERYNIIKQKN